MKVTSARLYGFHRATLADLVAAINKFCEGQAVTNVETGTVAYAAGEARGREFVEIQYMHAGAAEFSAVILYTE